MMLQLPEPSAVAVPICVAPSRSRTVLPASAVPVKVGDVTLVMLSVGELPLSDPAVRSGALGAVGGVLSSAKVMLALAVLPAVSVSVTTTVWLPSAIGAV